jgi:hypothetical protein
VVCFFEKQQRESCCHRPLLFGVLGVGDEWWGSNTSDSRCGQASSLASKQLRLGVNPDVFIGGNDDG